MQAYLDSARQGGEVGRTAGVPFNFRFYLHKENLPSAAAEEGEAAITAGADGARTTCTCMMQQPWQLPQCTAVGISTTTTKKWVLTCHATL